MRTHLPLATVIESTPEPTEWLVTSGYVEPVTKISLVLLEGETVKINPTIIIASIIPFMIVLIMVVTMIFQ
jgi:hypothetical protein